MSAVSTAGQFAAAQRPIGVRASPNTQRRADLAPAPQPAVRLRIQWRADQDSVEDARHVAVGATEHERRPDLQRRARRSGGADQDTAVTHVIAMTSPTRIQRAIAGPDDVHADGETQRGAPSRG